MRARPSSDTYGYGTEKAQEPEKTVWRPFWRFLTILLYYVEFLVVSLVITFYIHYKPEKQLLLF